MPKIGLQGSTIWASLSNYAEMYRHESAAVTVIQQVNDWHLVNGFTSGFVGGGWSFHDGEQVAITAYANNGDGKTRVTAAGHVMVNGDVLSISGTTNYDGVWAVEQVAAGTFVINTAFVADDGASVGEHGSHFVSSTPASTGRYLISYSLSITPASANCVVEATIFVNATQCIKCESQVKLGAVSDYQVVTDLSVENITVNDIISVAIRNTSDGGDFTIRNGNITLIRVG